MVNQTCIDHKLYGTGTILAVRQLDSGAPVADVKFADGTTRCIRLSQEYWTSDVSDLTPTPPKVKRVRKPKSAPAMPEKVTVTDAAQTS